MNQISEHLKDTEGILKKYKHIIGIAIFVMLLLLGWQLYKFNELQKEIIKTGGYVDGKIKCACTQEAWNNHVANNIKLNLSEISKGGFDNGE